MNLKLSSALIATVFGMVLLSSTAVAGTETDAWSKEAFADPCMNGDVPADGVVRASEMPTTDA